MRSYGIFGEGVIFILGIVWCWVILGRFRSDLEEFNKTKDFGHKGVIVFYWVLTVPIMIVMAFILWRTVGGILHLLD